MKMKSELEIFQDVIYEYPYPVALVFEKLRRGLERESALESLFLLKDCFEMLTRYCCLIALSVCHRESLIPDKNNEAWAGALVKPSTSTWHWFLENLVERAEIAKIDDLNPLRDWLFNEKKYVSRVLTEFTSFRNDALGHGAARSSSEYYQLLQKWLANLNNIISRATFLRQWLLLRRTGGRMQSWMGIESPKDIPLEVAFEREEEYFLQMDGIKSISLYPYLLMLHCPFEQVSQLFFYDSQKNFSEKKKELAVIEYSGGHKIATKQPISKLEELWTSSLLCSAWRSSIKRMEKLEKDLYNFSGIRSHHTDFVGREFVFDDFSKFCAENDRGFFLITGPPGMGKSAIVAHYIEDNPDAVHFFYRRNESCLTPDMMVRHIMRMLMYKHAITDTNPTDNPEQMRFKLAHLLGIVSEKYLRQEEREIVLIDALDEAGIDPRDGSRYSIIPCTEIPPKVYFILTSREGGHLEVIKTLQPLRHVELKSHSNENLSDCVNYLETRIGKLIPDRERLEQLAANSEGNFLFLRFFTDSVLRGEIDTESLDFTKIRFEGLENLYKNYWSALNGNYQTKPLYLQALYSMMGVLSAAVYPLSRDQLLIPLEIPAYIGENLLRQVIQTLETCEVNDEIDTIVGYRIYHSTFKQFLIDKLSGDFPKLLEKLADSLDMGEPLAGSACLSLLIYFESLKPLRTKEAERPTDRTKCGMAVQKMLEIPVEEDIDVLLDFAKYCQERGWWPREQRVFKLISETLRADSELYANSDRVAEISLEMAKLAINQGRYEEARNQLKTAIDQFRQLDDKKGECLALYWRGNSYLWQDEYDEAERAYLEANELNQEVKDKEILALTLHDRAVIQDMKDNYPLAHRMLDENVKNIQECGLHELLGDNHLLRANLYMLEEKYQFAREQMLKGLDIYHSINSAYGELTALMDLGDVAYAIDEISEAMDYFRRAHEMARDIGYQQGIAMNLSGLGDVYASKGDTLLALDYHQRALKLFEKLDNKDKISWSQKCMGISKVVLGEFDEAEELLKKSEKYEKDFGSDIVTANVLLDRVGCDLARGNISEAEKRLNKIANLISLDEPSNGNASWDYYLKKGWVCLERGLFNEAIASAESARLIAVNKKIPRMEYLCDELVCLVKSHAGNFEGCVETEIKIISGFEHLGFALLAADSQLILAQLYLLAGDFEGAANIGTEAVRRFDKMKVAHLTAFAEAVVAFAQCNRGQVEGLETVLEESVLTLDRFGACSLKALVTGWLGIILQMKGSKSTSKPLIERAVDLFHKQGIDNAFSRQIKHYVL